MPRAPGAGEGSNGKPEGILKPLQQMQVACVVSLLMGVFFLSRFVQSKKVGVCACMQVSRWGSPGTPQVPPGTPQVPASALFRVFFDTCAPVPGRECSSQLLAWPQSARQVGSFSFTHPCVPQVMPGGVGAALSLGMCAGYLALGL